MRIFIRPLGLQLGLVALGITVRLLVGQHLPHYGWVSDELEYWGAAQSLAAGHGFSFYQNAPWMRPPLYIIFVALARSPQAIYIIQVLLLSSTVFPLTAMTSRLWGMRAALAVGLAIDLYYPWAVYPNLLLSESIGVFLVTWAAWLALQRRWLLSALAGIMLGMGSLARGLVGGLVFPFALHQAASGKWPNLVAMLLMWVAVQIPWVTRNYVTFGRLAMPDLTGGYNLWYAAEGVRNEARIQSELSGIANPIDRDRHALSQALHIIARDPWKFTLKGLKELTDLWLPNFASEERLVSGFTLGSVAPWHLIATFVLGDLLFAILSALAVFGLLVKGINKDMAQSLLWIAYLCAAAFILFATDRFRVLLVPPVAALAGAGLASLSLLRLERPTSRTVLSGLASLSIVALMLWFYPFDLLSMGVSRWFTVQQLATARRLALSGNLEAASQIVAAQDRSFVETRILGLQLGVLSSHRENLPTDPKGMSDLDAMAIGDLWRYFERWELAEKFLTASQVSSSERTDWMWGRSLSPPQSQLDIGSGLDIGFIKGFQRPEWDGQQWFRWTTRKAEVRLSAGANSSRIIVKMAGYRPPGWPPVRTQLIVDGTTVWEGEVAWPWKEVSIYTAGTPGTVDLAIMSDTFVPGFHDKRELGVMVSQIRVERR